jgi:hypothetical protein
MLNLQKMKKPANGGGLLILVTAAVFFSQPAVQDLARRGG